MNGGLKNFPRSIRSRDTLYRRFDKIRALRNRVFHHEPIWNRDDLLQCHDEIVEYIGYVNPTLRGVVDLTDRFATVYDDGNGWRAIKNSIESKLLPPEHSAAPH